MSSLLAGISLVGASEAASARACAERSAKRDKKDRKKAAKREERKQRKASKRRADAVHAEGDGASKRAKRHASGSSDSDSSDDERHEDGGAAPAKAPDARAEAGMDWMSNPAHQRAAREEVEEPAALAAAAEAAAKAQRRAGLELNPFWASNGDGLPGDATGAIAPARPAGAMPSQAVGVGDGGVSWRMKALRRAQERAAQEGRSLDSVVQERWGALATLTADVTRAPGASARAHLRATAERRETVAPPRQLAGGGHEGDEEDEARMQPGERERGAYLRDVGRDGAGGRRMVAPAQGGTLSWRAGGAPGSAPPAGGGSRPGDWRCPQCAPPVTCFAFRKSCHRCGCAAPGRQHEGEPPARRGAPAGPAAAPTPAAALACAARELNQFAGDGSFFAQHRQGGAGDAREVVELEPSDAEQEEEEDREHVREPVREHVREAAPRATAGAAAAGGNAGAAAALRARLLGRPAPPPACQEEVVALPLVTEDGRAAPGAFGRAPAAPPGAHPSRRPPKLQRFDAPGQKARYYADDDACSLRDLVAQEKHGGTGGAQYDANLARNIASAQRYKGTELAVDDEYDHDGGLDMYEQRKGPRGQPAAQTAQRAKAAAVADFQRASRLTSTCALCFDNPGKPRHLHISYAAKSYLMLPELARLVPSHALIVPMLHGSSARSCDEDVHEELRNFKKCLLKLHAAAGRAVLFMETHLGGQLGSCKHACIEAVPLPPGVAASAPLYFRKAIDEAESEWSTHDAKKCIALSGSKGLRSAIPAHFPYFHVEFGLHDGFVHVIDDVGNWNPHFGRDVLIGLLDLPGEWTRARQRRPSLAESQAQVKDFVKEWAPHDWTAQL